MPASVWIVNLVVLGVVFEADLGRRKITWFRLLRPIVLAAGIIAYYLKGVATRGNGLTLELLLATAGLLLGVAAGAIFRVARDGDGAARSTAGIAYAGLWAVVIGARLGFAYATGHSQPIQHWLAVNRISSAALGDALIFMAGAMLLARTGTLLARSRRQPGLAARVEPRTA